MWKKSSGVRLNDARLKILLSFHSFPDVNDDDADVYDDPFHDILCFKYSVYICLR